MDLLKVLRLAWWDSRRNRGRLMLCTASITLGTAALVGLQGLSEQLQQAVVAESRELLGADLLVSANQPLDSTLVAAADSLMGATGQRAQMTAFNSMVFFPRPAQARLADVRALEPGYPFYGQWQADPPQAPKQVFGQRAVLVDDQLAAQFQLGVDDSVQIGRARFRVAGVLRRNPGEVGTGISAPQVYMHLKHLPATQLITYGSRVSYRAYYRLPPTADPDGWVKLYRPRMNELRIRASTVKERRESLGQVFTNLFRFFNLVGFVALVLGGVGVASSVGVYVRQRRLALATLRCLGATAGQATALVWLQLLGAGLLGTAVGVLLGIAFQLSWPWWLPQGISLQLQPYVVPGAVAAGVVMGLGLTVVFSALPLAGISRISPLQAVRASLEPAALPRLSTAALVSLVGVAIFALASWQAGSATVGLVYTLSLAVALVLLAGLGILLRRVLRGLTLGRAAFAVRQGVANLYRPGNQTTTLVVTLGLGITLLGTLFLVRQNLDQQVSRTLSGSGTANALLFDIQPSQQAGVDSLLRQAQMRVLESTPVVTARLVRVKGIPFTQLQADTTRNIPFWAGEYRVSYRDSLLSSEKLSAGQWQGAARPGEVPSLSLATFTAELLGLTVGDTVEFNVQGVPLTATIGSLREQDFLRVRPNFQWIFPTGVLEQAPRFYFLLARYDSTAQLAAFQRQAVQQYPNVAVLDVTAVLSEAEELLGRVAYLVNVLGLVSLLTGGVVLLAALAGSQAQRVREAVLLRTLGAVRRQVFQVAGWEYWVLGSMAALAGWGMALTAANGMVALWLDADFRPVWWAVLVGTAAPAGVVLLLGVWATRRVVSSPPLQVLREQVD